MKLNRMKSKALLVLSSLLSILIIVTSYVGLTQASLYSLETVNWKIQSIGQDGVNLFLLVPFLLISSVYSFKGNSKALFIWSGSLLYTIYTFTIYCFGVHFNKLFLLYCLILGIAFYLFSYFLFTQIRQPLINKIKGRKIRIITAIYFITIACLFYLLWLSGILRANFSNELPPELMETGLVTNPIHVLDLSICLPGFFITGLLLLKQKSIGLVLAPAFLTFCILMDITIAVLTWLMHSNNLPANPIVAVIMVFLALFSAVLLIVFLKEAEIG